MPDDESQTETEPDEDAAAPAEDGDDDHDDEWEPTEAQLQRLTAALANLDDASLKRALATMREPSRLEIAQQLNLSKATMHLGDALVPLFRRKMLSANSPRQMAVAFALAEQTNEETIAALGDRSEDPTRADMLEALPGVIDHQGVPLVALMLASYAASDAQCQAVCSELLDDDERFALPDAPEIDVEPEPQGIVTFTRNADDPAQAAKRAARKEAKAAKRAAEAAKRDAKATAQSARTSAQHRAKRAHPS